MLDRRTVLKSGAAAFAVAAAAPALAADAKLNALFDQFVQEDLDLSPPLPPRLASIPASGRISAAKSTTPRLRESPGPRQ
jgi:hypothetical protein